MQRRQCHSFQELFFHTVYGGATPQVLCEIPTVRQANGLCRIDVVTRDGKIVGGMNYTMPHDTKPFFLWTPSPLPITSQDGEMAITLKNLKVGHPRAQDTILVSTTAFPPSYGIQPELTVQENGQSSSDWQLCDDDWWQTRKRAAPVRNTSGERSSLANCTLSPRDDIWHLDLALVKKSAALPPEQKIEFHCQIPAENSSVVVDKVQKLGPASITLLGVAGAGSVSFTAVGPRFFRGGQTFPVMNTPQRKITMIWQDLPESSNPVMNISPHTNEDSNIIEAFLQPSRLTLAFEQPVPAIVLNASPWKSEHLQVDVFDEQGRQLAGQKLRFMEVALWMPQAPLPPAIQTVTVRVSFQEPRRWEFFVAPPRQAILDHLAQQDSADVKSALGELRATPGAQTKESPGAVYEYDGE